jgi:hypothetical protein
METTKWNYFQFRKSHNYPLYLRFKQEDLHQKYNHIATELGFSLLSEAEAKKIPLQRVGTKILTVQTASPRTLQLINTSDSLDKYGHESISLQLGTVVYTYRKVGSMVMPHAKTLWDLALSPELTQTEHMVGLRVILVRFLSQALSEEGVISYWGTIKDDTIIMMKQSQSFGEAVFIDLQKKVIFSNGGEMKMGSALKIIRKDKETSSSYVMNREDLIGFLSVSTCLLGFKGITPAMKKSIFELSRVAHATYAAPETRPNL